MLVAGLCIHAVFSALAVASHNLLLSFLSARCLHVSLADDEVVVFV